MKCLILAAGYATRLYPLTKNFPKPLLKVKNKTIIDWLLDDLENSDKIDEYIIVTNRKFIDYFNDWKLNSNLSKKITIIDDKTTSNENRLGAVCDIALVIEKLNINDDMLVLAGDNLLDFSLKKFIEFYEKKNSTCIMTYYTDDIKQLQKSANIKIDSKDKVLNIIEKPQTPISNWCCPAFYIYVKEDVKKVKIALKDGCKKDAPGSFICWLYDKSNVYAYQMPGNRYDIGTIESYDEVNKNYNGISKRKGKLK